MISPILSVVGSIRACEPPPYKNPADRQGFYCCLLCVGKRVLVLPVDDDFKVKVGAG